MKRNNKGQFVPEYEVNYDFFSEISCKTSSFAGLIAADGTVRKDKDEIKISLSSSDKQLLEDWKKEVGYTGPVRTGRENAGFSGGFKEMSTLTIGRIPLWKSTLAREYNIKPNKTYNLEPPNLRKQEHILSFISGYIDGDGSIVRNSEFGDIQLWVYGRLSLCEWVKQQFDLFYPTNRNYKGIYPHYSIFRFSIRGKRAGRVLEDMVSLELPRLQRKWSIINNFRG